MLKCEVCGKETEYNYGKSSEVKCHNCGKLELDGMKKKRRNYTAFAISFCTFLLLGFTILGTFFSFASGLIYQAIYIFVSGTVLALFLFGLSEIISQLTLLNSKIDEKDT